MLDIKRPFLNVNASLGRIDRGEEGNNLLPYYSFSTADDEYGFSIYIEPDCEEKKLKIFFDTYPFEFEGRDIELLYDLDELDEEMLIEIFFSVLGQYILWMRIKKIPDE